MCAWLGKVSLKVALNTSVIRITCEELGPCAQLVSNEAAIF